MARKWHLKGKVNRREKSTGNPETSGQGHGRKSRFKKAITLTFELFILSNTPRSRTDQAIKGGTSQDGSRGGVLDEGQNSRGRGGMFHGAKLLRPFKPPLALSAARGRARGLVARPAKSGGIKSPTPHTPRLILASFCGYLSRISLYRLVFRN